MCIYIYIYIENGTVMLVTIQAPTVATPATYFHEGLRGFYLCISSMVGWISSCTTAAFHILRCCGLLGTYRVLGDVCACRISVAFLQRFGLLPHLVIPSNIPSLLQGARTLRATGALEDAAAEVEVADVAHPAESIHTRDLPGLEL